MSFQDLYNQSENKILENKAKDQSTKQAEGPSYMQQVYQNFANPVKSVGEFGSAFHSIANNIDDSNKSREMAYRQQSQLGSANRARANAAPSASGTAPARNFDFSTLSSKAKLDPSILGTAPARGFDFANMKKSLQNAGRQAGEAATSGVEHWVKSPGITSPMEVWKRRNQALGAQKSIGSAVDAAGKTISGIQSGAQRVGSGLMSSGSSLMGMGKQSDVAAPSAGSAPAPKAAAPAPKVTAPAPAVSSNNSNAFSGAASGVGDAFSAGFGNQEALKRVQDDLNRPNYSQLNDTASALGSAGANAFGGIGNTALHAAQLSQHYLKSKYDNASFASKAMFAYNNPKLLMDTSNIKDRANNFSEGLSNSYAKAKEEAASSEGRRMAAGVTMPVLNFMQNNPWAKYLLGALGTGVAGYGLHSMFGGQQKQQNGQAEGVLQNSYNQGLKGA